jgi:cardiolipin synthase
MSSGPTIIHWLTLHGLVTVVAVLSYVMTAHVMHQRRHPAAAIAWILFILLLPYLALPTFLLFGSRKLERPRAAQTLDASAKPSTDAWAVETIVALGQPAPAAYSELRVHKDGQEARDALLETIDGARHSIDLCTFILARDRFGETVIDRLCDKARSGVRVRLLLDGLGRLMAGRPNLKRLTAAGGELALFVPPLRSPLKGRTNLRNHRKLLVADAATSAGRLWCGGRNLATEYFDGGQHGPPWRDLTFDLRGPLVQQAGALFEHDWVFARGQTTAMQWPAAQATASDKNGAQIVASGPDQMDDTVHALLVTAVYRARRSISLVTPYFVPESALLMALCLAARRGVAVDLLLPARSNHRLSDLARGRALRALAQAGARVWLAPGMLHAKLVVIDDVLALAGSANLDSRSLFLNYELMVAFHKADDVRRFAAWFEQNRTPARPYAFTPPGLIRDVAEGMLLWLGFQL